MVQSCVLAQAFLPERPPHGRQQRARAKQESLSFLTGGWLGPQEWPEPRLGPERTWEPVVPRGGVAQGAEWRKGLLCGWWGPLWGLGRAVLTYAVLFMEEF